jgi:hypothetical protein
LQALLNFRERVRHFRRSPKLGCQKMFAESGLAAWLAGPRANNHYRCLAFPATRGSPS